MAAATSTRKKARAGGRSARRALRSGHDVMLLPGLSRALPTCELMDTGQIERLDEASMHILENTGVVYRDPVALEDWRRVGAKGVSETVYLDRGLMTDLIATIAADFTCSARNPSNNLRLGGQNSVFVSMTGAPYLRGLDDVRRAPMAAMIASW